MKTRLIAAILFGMLLMMVPATATQASYVTGSYMVSYDKPDDLTITPLLTNGETYDGNASYVGNALVGRYAGNDTDVMWISVAEYNGNRSFPNGKNASEFFKKQCIEFAESFGYINPSSSTS